MPSQKITQGVIVVAVLIVGFFAGMEFKAYQIRSAVSEAFGEMSKSLNGDQPVADEKKDTKEEPKQNATLVQKKMGEEIELSTFKFKVNSSEEKTIIENANPYIKPIESKEDTKLILVDLDVMNTTKTEFYFDPKTAFVLIDNQEREFSVNNQHSITIENFLERMLTPSINENGVILFEIPKDASSYGLVIQKAETNEVYIVRLK